MTESQGTIPEPLYDRRADTISSWRSVARIALVVYVVAVAFLAYWCWGDSARWDAMSLRPSGSAWIAQVVGHLAAGILRELFLFFILGLLAGAACVSVDAAGGFLRPLMQVGVAFLLSIAIAIGVSVLLDGTPLVAPPFPMTIAISVVCLWGCCLGSSWVQAENGLRWFAWQAIGFASVSCLAIACLAVGSTTNTPLAIEPQEVSTEDRRRLVGLLQGHDPRKLEEGTTTELTLSQDDLNQFASWGLTLLRENAQVGVDLTDERVQFNVMMESPQVSGMGKYVTLSTGGQVIARSGEVGFLPDQFQLGRLKIPAWLMRLSGPFLIGHEWRHDQSDSFFRSLKNVQIGDQAVTVSYGPMKMSRGTIREALVELGVLEDLEDSISAQISRMEQLAQQQETISFGQCVEAVFDEAQKRSSPGQAARENRAAILTLAYLVGHSGIRSLLGSDVPSKSDRLRAALHGTKLRDRADWVQHFTVSAALKVISGASASRDIGILKEELDADGGSGFSFGDILADRSGTLMALHATHSEESARAMQDRITAGFREADFIPPGADLPEGLPDEEFQRIYGGVGGAEYQKVISEIDRRISECDAYRGAL